jgi:zinc D-Ala-D-Ala carboxypeptidase
MNSVSAHFSLEEVTHSQTAARLGIDNDLPLDLMPNVKKAALGMELVRLALNSNAIIVSSWYRCPELNAAVGSKNTSAHPTGFAIDFTCPTYGPPEKIVRDLMKSSVPFQQIIHEFDSWVHIAFNGDQKQALVIDHLGTRDFA